MLKIIDNWLLRHWPRYRLWRICKATNIKPYKWQKMFALGQLDYLPPEVRKQWGSGKTTAIFLRILMIPKNNAAAWAEAGRLVELDPSCLHPNFSKVLRIYSMEYRRLRDLCLAAGIPVLQVEIYRMLREFDVTRLVNDTV